jgi:hypothetical protein
MTRKKKSKRVPPDRLFPRMFADDGSLADRVDWMGEEEEIVEPPDNWPLPALQEQQEEQESDDQFTDDQFMDDVLCQHPDLARMMLDGQLPDELIDDDGNAWSPWTHIQLHIVVERQLAGDKPAGIRATALSMERDKKLSQHDIRHVIAAALAEQIWHAVKEQRTFDEALYFRDIARNYLEWLAAR